MRLATFELKAGARELQVVQVGGRERLSEAFELELVVAHGGFDPSGLVGERATLTFHGAAGSRAVTGVVAQVRDQGSGDGGRTFSRARLVPRFALLGIGRRSRIFQELSVPEIVAAVLDKRGLDVEARLARAYPKRAYAVQYEESDRAFVERILAEVGISFFFECRAGATDDARDFLVLFDAPSAYAPLPGGAELPLRAGDERVGGEHLTRFSLERNVALHGVLLTGFDVARPTHDGSGHARADADQAATGQAHWHERPFSPESVSDDAARVTLEQHRATQTSALGLTNCPRLAPGLVFQVDGHATLPSGAPFVVLEVEHEGRAPEAAGRGGSAEREPTYLARFVALPASMAYRPPRPERRFRQSVEQALVVGPPGEEIHTDELGRVKVQFPWDRDSRGDDRSSAWIRTMMPWAGAAFGAQFVPRVGMEVVVGFVGGDPDQPVVLGCLYDGANVPPFALPERKTQSGLRTRSSPGGAGANELRFDDAAGEEEVRIHAARDLVALVEHDRKTEIRHDDKTTVLGDRTLEVEQDFIRKVNGNEIVIVERNLVFHVIGATVMNIRGENVEYLEPERPELEEQELAKPPTEAEARASEDGERTRVVRDLRRQDAALVWLAEQLEGAEYERALARHRDARALAQRAVPRCFEARDLAIGVGSAPLEVLAPGLERVTDAARALRRELAPMVEDALLPVPESMGRFQALLYEHLAAVDRALASAVDVASQARQGRALVRGVMGGAQPSGDAFGPTGGVIRGGGGGDDKFTKNPKSKASELTITGGGTIDSPDGFKLTAGASSIELTNGAITIKGPVVNIEGGTVNVKGKPINLN